MKDTFYICPNCKVKEINLEYLKRYKMSGCISVNLTIGGDYPFSDFGDHNTNCLDCGTELINTHMKGEEVDTITEAIGYIIEKEHLRPNKSIPMFDEMIKLKTENPFEFRRKYKIYEQIYDNQIADFLGAIRKLKTKDQQKADSKCIPKCPTCGSTNIQKIGTGEKFVSGAFWGLLSTKVHKTFKCKNCGMMF